jgi:hypothetical protein
MRGGLLNIGVATGVYGLNAVQRVLKIGGCNKNRINIFSSIEFIVVAD